MSTILEIKDQADRALFADQHATALALYVRIIAAQPAQLDAPPWQDTRCVR